MFYQVMQGHTWARSGPTVFVLFSMFIMSENVICGMFYDSYMYGHIKYSQSDTTSFSDYEMVKGESCFISNNKG